VRLEQLAPFVVCYFSVACLLFSFFLAGQGSVCPGAYAGSSQGWLWEYRVPLICSPVGLQNVSQAGLSWHLATWKPSCFFSVTWHGETLFGLRVWGVEVLILLGAFFLPSVAPASQQNF
jgi:hypothetical protein